MRRQNRTLRRAIIALILAVMWTAVGAPIRQAEWVDVPSRLTRTLRQTVGRSGGILRCWLAFPMRSGGAKAASADGQLMLTVWDESAQIARQTPLESYTAGVVAAEMPVSYHPEALKSQAVAARTRAVWSCAALGGRGCARHPDCDVCTDSTCCQGYLSEEARQTKWGTDTALYETRIENAVAATAGRVLCYDGMPAQILYHACAGGQTEDAAAVFAQAVPYLVSVDSPGEESFSSYYQDVRISRNEVAEKLLAAFPECGVTAEDLPGQLELRATTGSGRASVIRVGATEVTGVQLRQALGLKSTMLTWDADDDVMIFHVQGAGHGVGMSQTGAQAMASGGADYEAILVHYYPGTYLASMPQV